MMVKHLQFASSVGNLDLRIASNEMSRRRRRSDCPVHFALDVFGDAWTLLVVRDLMFKGRTTFSDFARAEEGIATNILADRLARLEADRIVELEGRHYRLTSKGIDLLPILLAIIGWSAKYDPKTAADRAFVRRLRSDPRALEDEIRNELSKRRKATP
jgi:DNA-binding HxlR family transcriptional regulator